MKRHWQIGAIAGLIFATLVLFVAYRRVGDGLGAETLVQYVSSLPVFIAMKAWPSAPDYFPPVVFVLYWVASGSFVSFALGGNVREKIAGIIVLALLVYAHCATKVILEDQLAGAAKAFANFFIEMDLFL